MSAKDKAIKSVKDKLIKALMHLGCTGKVTVKSIDEARYEVSINGQYFGIFDTDRQTFVD